MATATRSKEKLAFICRECGAEQAKWHGRCPDCGEWGSLAEEARPVATSTSPGNAPVPLDQVSTKECSRRPAGISEFDRVLGGGLVAGSSILLAGDPGIGKSTLVLQASGGIARTGGKVLYVSGEESPSQVKLRADRLGIEGGGIEGGGIEGGGIEGGGIQGERILLFASNDLNEVLAHARSARPDVLVVDSIQTMSLPNVSSAAGSVTQVRECASVLTLFAMQTGIAVILIGHVTKNGDIAGPRILAHVVDAVLSFEGDRYHACRVLRAVKNRFGATEEVGLFEMSAAGLVEITSPAGLLLGTLLAPGPGSVVVPAVEGTRVLLVEMQALSSPSPTPPSRRRATGIDPTRLDLLLAVLGKRGRIMFSGEDVFVNVAGGVRIEEPGTDLAVALAVASSFTERDFPPDTVAFGEIGLRGEVRPVPRSRARLAEAAKLGFRRALVPPDTETPGGIEVEQVRMLTDALAILGSDEGQRSTPSSVLRIRR